MAETALSLPLFMTRITAHDVHHPAAAYDFAVFTDSPDAGTYFHGLIHTNFQLRYKALKYKRLCGYYASPGKPGKNVVLIYFTGGIVLHLSTTCLTRLPTDHALYGARSRLKQ